MRRGLLGGALWGWLAGGVAAGCIGVLSGYAVIDSKPFVDGQTNTFRMIWENVLFCSIVGGIVGGSSYSLVGACLGLVAGLSEGNYDRVLQWAAMVSCAAIGTFGGAIASLFVTGAGHDGTPVHLGNTAIGASVGFTCGLIGGFLHGRRLANSV